jgi:SlyX protein
MQDERLVDIETKLSHQEILIEELNQVLYRQQETIDQLQKALKVLVKRVPEGLGNEIGPAKQKPPHY